MTKLERALAQVAREQNTKLRVTHKAARAARAELRKVEKASQVARQLEDAGWEQVVGLPHVAFALASGAAVQVRKHPNSLDALRYRVWIRDWVLRAYNAGYTPSHVREALRNPAALKALKAALALGRGT